MRICQVCLGLVLALASCTAPVERSHLIVIIDAEQSLRARVRYVDVEVRRVSPAAKVSDLVQTNQLMPGGESGWPLEFRVSGPKAGSQYEVTAIAKAVDDSTLTTARALRAYDAGQTVELRLRFDEACAARPTPCPSTYNCSEGTCIDVWGTAQPPVASSDQPEGRESEPPPPDTEPARPAEPSACDKGDPGACRACPAGLAGSAAEGCSPVLLALELSSGELQPEFAPEHTMYSADLPLLAGQVVLQLRAAKSVEVLANGTAIADDGRLPVKLGFGDNKLLVTLSADGFPTRSYRLNLRRGGAQVAQLSPAHGSPGDAFGTGLAVSGDRLVIGAPKEDGSSRNTPPDEGAMDSGAAYVFQRTAGGWEEQTYLKGDSIRAGAHFGLAVALDGDWVAVSAPEDTGGGAVYLYERQADDWTQRTVLREPSGGRFGAAMLLRGDTLFVGNPGDSSVVRGAGATFVYERDKDGWSRTHTLRAARPGTDEWVGSGFALEGDTLFVGSTGPLPHGTGRVLVFQHVGNEWREQQTLTPEPAELGSCFGSALAVTAERLVIGAFNGTVGLTGGVAYVYQRGLSGSFEQRAVLRPDNTRSGDYFASGLALTDTTLVIGAPQESSADRGVGTPANGALDRSGALYLFDSDEGTYRQRLQIKNDAPRATEELGRNVAVGGDEIFVSAPADADRDGKSASAGSVYVFR